MAMKRKTVFALFVVAIFVLVFFFVVEFYMGDVQVEFNSQTLNSMATPDHWHTESDLKIPLVVHHTWKRTTAPPSELVRWRKGCMKLNRDYTFVMYNDEDLLAFTRLHYKQYLPMFEHLHGVYMADMARVLLAYHFGGIYMDLDFYCHRPFKCLLKHVRTLLQQQQQQQSHRLLTNTNSTSTSAASASVEHAPLPKDVLVVSREPLAHAVLFRNKTRVVIQDFFLSTPKHPFFLWFLNDRWDAFTKSNAYPLPSSASVGSASAGNSAGSGAGVSSGSASGGSVGSGSGGYSNSTSGSVSRKLSSNHTTHAHHHSHHVVDSRPAFAKGPFSYSIEKDIDRYLQYKKDKRAGIAGTASPPTTASPSGGDTSSSSSASSGVSSGASSGSSGDDDAILELHEDLMHALIDSTNSRLHSTCAALKGKESDTGGATLGAARKEVCKDMNAGRYFKPTKHTILVHMWTHVYLGWSFVRGLYNAYTYHTVESTLPQIQECF